MLWDVFRMNQKIQIIEASGSKVVVAEGGQNRTLDSQGADFVSLELPADSDQFTDSNQIPKIVTVEDLRQPVLILTGDTRSSVESPGHKRKQPCPLGPMQEIVPAWSELRLPLHFGKGLLCRSWRSEIEQNTGRTRINHF